MKKFKVVVDYNNIMSVLEVLERHGINWRGGYKATSYNPYEDYEFDLGKWQIIRLLYKKNRHLVWDRYNRKYKKYKSYTAGDIINERFLPTLPTEFDFNKIMQPNTVVWCDKEWKANELLKWADSKGMKWCSGGVYIEFNQYNSYLDFYNYENYTIYKYEDVLAVKDKFDGNN